MVRRTSVQPVPSFPSLPYPFLTSTHLVLISSCHLNVLMNDCVFLHRQHISYLFFARPPYISIHTKLTFPYLVPNVALLLPGMPFSLCVVWVQVVECARRLMLTGILVFIAPDTPGQVAFGCIFAFIRYTYCNVRFDLRGEGVIGSPRSFPVHPTTVLDDATLVTNQSRLAFVRILGCDTA